LLLALMPSGATGQGADRPRLELDTRRTLLLSDNDGTGIQVIVTLADPGHLRLRVADFDGRTVRELFDGRREAGMLTRTWRGLDEAGDPVPEGPYRLVAEAAVSERAFDDEAERAEAWVTVASRQVYPPGPGLINVAIDPGHGGMYDGAVGPDGTREADLDLDIGLRLARMLEAAGVNVVLTRDSDREVNDPPMDLTGDGLVDDTDELAARPDIANLARADLFISVHNNIAVNESVGGPATLYSDQRTFSDRSRRLARFVQSEMLAALRGIASGGWQPYEREVLTYPYYVLRDYDPPRLLRPTQMPGVLSEGLFLSNPRELRLLKDRRVRQAMAVAYYDAIARYLARRGSHVGYEFQAGPSRAVAGERVLFVIEVRNQGTESLRGWDLVAAALPTESPYVGRVRGVEVVGERRIPRLEPGEAATLTLEVTAPSPGQEWMLLFDARDPDDRRASQSGSPVLQVPLLTFGSMRPPPTPWIQGHPWRHGPW
jgi:N-acetylmuramoyl-L-alanine amidase